MNKDEAEKRWIDYIKASAETISNHAEEWVKDIDYQTGVEITIRLKPGEVPEVEYATTIIPEGIVKKYGV